MRAGSLASYYNSKAAMASTNDAVAVRLALIARGYTPIPLYGKAPPNTKNNKRRSMTSWEQTDNVTREMIEMWGKIWPDAINTGILTRFTPALDLDILNEEAARAVEELVREKFEERGFVVPRIGKPPKRAILFRTIEPFSKIVADVTAPNGGGSEKVEFLGDGQQVVADGIHPDTGRPYAWHGGSPTQTEHDDLPYISADEARQLVEDIVALLCRDFGYTRAKDRPRRRKGNGAAAEAEAGGGAADWQYLTDNIRAGRDLHKSTVELAAKMVTSGMNAGAAVNMLRAIYDGATYPHDDRWRKRRDDIPRLVASAEQLREEEKPQQAPAAAPMPLAAVIRVFDKWLVLKDHTPIYAVLGTVAANLLPGDPVWLGIIAPPSSAKTEILNSISKLPNVIQVATLTPAALLSGTPKKQRASGTKGGLLRQIGDLGIISLKDFGSVLSMRPEAKAEVLAALRELFDGA